MPISTSYGNVDADSQGRLGCSCWEILPGTPLRQQEELRPRGLQSCGKETGGSVMECGREGSREKGQSVEVSKMAPET